MSAQLGQTVSDWIEMDKGYTATLLTDHSVDFVEKHKGERHWRKFLDEDLPPMKEILQYEAWLLE